MPQVPYQTITPDADYSGGIDQLSPEGSIPPGHAEDALNFELGNGGVAAKRKGWEPHAALPHRVVRLAQAAGASAELSIYLDGSVDVSQVHSTPIAVRGRTLLSTGDFPQAVTARWYPGFSADVRLAFPTGGSTTRTLAADSHGFGTADLLVGVAQSTSTSSRDNSLVLPDSVVLPSAPAGAIDVTLNNAGLDTVYAYAYVLSNQTVAGTSWRGTFATGTFTPSAGLDIVTVTPGTHGLSTPDILVQCYTIDGSGNRTLFVPDLVRNSLGTITIGWTAGSIVGPGVASVLVLLRAVTSTKTAEGTVAPGATASVSLTGLGTPFLVAQPYVEVAGVWEACLPDSLDVDSAAMTASCSFVNPTASSARFRVVWAEAQARTNKLVVTAQTTIGAAQDTATSQAVPDVELTLWGLPTTAGVEDRPVTAVDAYRSEAAADVLVATSGWNLLAETPSATPQALRYPRLRARVGSSAILAPAFHSASDSVLRTRGGWRFSGAEEGWGSVSAVAFAGTPGQVRVTVATPGRITTGSPVRVEDSNSCADALTLREALHASMNGTWNILAVDSSSPSQLVFTLRMPHVDSADWNFTAQGQAGVFTDFISLDLVSELSKTWRPAVGDAVRSSSFPAGTDVRAWALRNSTAFENLCVGPVSGTTSVGAGQLVTFEHAGVCLGLRSLDGTSTATTDDVVVGDVLAPASGTRRAVRAVRHLGTTVLGTLDVAADGAAATFTFQDASTTASLRVGDTLFVEQTGRLAGEWTVTSIDGDQVFTAEPASQALRDVLAQHAGLTFARFALPPGYVVLNYPGVFQDDDASSYALAVELRLAPAEFPRSATDSVPAAASIATRQFGGSAYSAAPRVRTTMAAGNLLATNGVDAPMKYDGANLSRAGLPRWQPGLFVLKSANASGIQMPADTTTAGSVSSGVFVCTTIGQASQFKDGDYVVASTGQFLTVRGDGDATTGKVRFVETPTGSPTTLARSATRYRYYFRASAVDAEGNLLATATSGAEDCVVELTTATQVRLRLTGLPAFPGLDFDRVALEVYRTRSGGTAPFYRVATLDVDYSAGASYSASVAGLVRPYIDFADAVPDASLLDADPLVLALTGAANAVGSFSGVEPPPRARLLTTVAGRAVYGDLRSWPRATLELVSNPAALKLDESWVVRKDSADTATDSDLVNRIGVRFGTGTLSATCTISAVSSLDFTVDVPTTLLAAFGYTPSAGQWVYLTHGTTSTAPRATFSGWWQIAEILSGTSFTVRCTGLSGYTLSATDDCTRVVACDLAGATLKHLPVFMGTDPNFHTRRGYAQPTGAANNRAPYIYTLLLRAAAAIRAAQWAYDPTYTPTMAPWVAAFAGDDFGGNILQLEFPQGGALGFPAPAPELQLGVSPVSTASTGLSFVGNGVPRDNTDSVGGVELLRPSRLAISFPGFPELVDRPFASDANASQSLVDVNPADGQGLTAILPFFGESAFGAAATGSVLVAFKADSIYVVDVVTRSVQRIESQGVGCSAPASPCLTRQGIVFAHTSGLYRLTRNLTVEPLGARLQRSWQQLVARDPAGMAAACGSTLADTRSARIFVAEPGASRATHGFTYQYPAERDGQQSEGAWSRLDNLRPTDFANLRRGAGPESFFGTWDGLVCRLLTAEAPDSYRDDSEPVGGSSGAVLTLRATDFGDAGVRKRVLHALATFRLPLSADGTGVDVRPTVEQAVELRDDWRPLDAATLKPAVTRDGLSSHVGVKQIQIRYAPAVSKAGWHQLRFSDTEIAAPLELVGVSYRVVGLSSKGTEEAASTH